MIEYNYEEMGKKIRTIRKSNKCSQEELIDKLSKKGFSIGRNKLSAIENGDVGYSQVGFLEALSKIFGCDIGYILGEYGCTTKETSDICEVTGLSEKAIDEIIKRKNENCAEQIDILSCLLQDTGFWRVLMAIRNAAESTAIAKGKFDERQERQIEWKYINGKQSAILRGQAISDHYLNTAINSFTAIIKNYVESRVGELAVELATEEKRTKDFLTKRGMSDDE